MKELMQINTLLLDVEFEHKDKVIELLKRLFVKCQLADGMVERAKLLNDANKTAKELESLITQIIFAELPDELKGGIV